MTKLRTEQDRSLLSAAIAAVCAVMTAYSLRPVILYYQGSAGATAAVLTAAAGAALVFPRLIRRSGITAGEAEKPNTGGRNTGLDLLRAFAVLMVITCHYTLSIGFADTPVQLTPYWWHLSMARWLAQTGVPLFMMLSGYFLLSHRYDRRHFSSFVHFLRNYFIIALLFLLKNRITTPDVLKQFVNLNYLWYINMYFGLALIAPALNAVVEGLSRDAFFLLLGILFVLSSLGTVFGEWFTSYWFGLYPLLYYGIGAGIRRYSVSAERKLPLLVILSAVLVLQSARTCFGDVGGVFNWYRNYGGYSNAYNAVPTVMGTTALFLLCKDISVKNGFLAGCLRQISSQSLEVYLLVCLFFGNPVYSFFERLLWDRLGSFGFWFPVAFGELALGTIGGIVLNFILDRAQGILFRPAASKRRPSD